MPTITTKAGPWNMTVFAYDDGDPTNPLGRVDRETAARVPFGAVELAADGRILAYNDTEPDGAGEARGTIVGRHFFDDVAKWAGNSAIVEEFRKGVDAGDLNAVFDCGVAGLSYKVRVHLKVSPILGTYWVFIKKLQRSAQ